MILFDVASLSQLSIAIETARRFKAGGEGFAVCYSGSSGEIGASVRSATEELGINYLDFKIMTEEADEPPFRGGEIILFQ